MESSVAHVNAPVSMDLELTRAPRRKEPLNLLTGVFLKSVHFLDPDLTKCVITGIFRNRGDSLGVLFKGRKGCLFWSHDAFNQLCVRFNEVTLALEGKNQFYICTDTGEDIKINNVFGQQYVYLYDGEHTLALNTNEWHQFVNNLPLVYTSLRDIFQLEESIKNYIFQLITEEGELETDLPSPIAERLFNEVSLYKRWPNGGRS